MLVKMWFRLALLASGDEALAVPSSSAASPGKVIFCMSTSVVEGVSGGGGWKMERTGGELSTLVSLGRMRPGEAAWLRESGEGALVLVALRPRPADDVLGLRLCARAVFVLDASVDGV